MPANLTLEGPLGTAPDMSGTRETTLEAALSAGVWGRRALHAVHYGTKGDTCSSRCPCSVVFNKTSNHTPSPGFYMAAR